MKTVDLFNKLISIDDENPIEYFGSGDIKNFAKFLYKEKLIALDEENFLNKLQKITSSWAYLDVINEFIEEYPSEKLFLIIEQQGYDDIDDWRLGIWLASMYFSSLDPNTFHGKAVMKNVNELLAGGDEYLDELYEKYYHEFRDKFYGEFIKKYHKEIAKEDCNEEDLLIDYFFEAWLKETGKLKIEDLRMEDNKDKLIDDINSILIKNFDYVPVF